VAYWIISNTSRYLPVPFFTGKEFKRLKINARKSITRGVVANGRMEYSQGSGRKNRDTGSGFIG
jgi:hypothetical protein